MQKRQTERLPKRHARSIRRRQSSESEWNKTSDQRWVDIRELV